MIQLTAFLKRHVLSIGSEFRSLGAQTEKDLYPYILRPCLHGVGDPGLVG